MQSVSNYFDHLFVKKMVLRDPDHTPLGIIYYAHAATSLAQSMLLFLDRIARTMYIDAVYCYRPSSMVCRSVYHTSKPSKNG